MKKLYILLALTAVSFQINYTTGMDKEQKNIRDCRSFFASKLTNHNSRLSECNPTEQTGECGIYNRFLDLVVARCSSLGPGMAVELTPSSCAEAHCIATGKKAEGEIPTNQCQQYMQSIVASIVGSQPGSLE